MAWFLALAVGITVLIATPARAGVLRAGDIVALTFEGVIVRIDPETGSQTVVASGGLLSDPHGLAVTPWGEISVVQSGNTVVRVSPFTGEQTLVTEGGLLSFAPDIAADAEGNLFLPSVTECPDTFFGDVVRVDRATGAQSQVLGCPTAGPELSLLSPLQIAFGPDGVVVLVLDFALNGSFGGIAAINTVSRAAGPLVFCAGHHIWPAGFAIAPDGTIVMTCLNTLTNEVELLRFATDPAPDLRGVVPTTKPFSSALAFDQRGRLIGTVFDPDGRNEIYRVDLRTRHETFLGSVPGRLVDIAVVPPICPCTGAKNHGSYVMCVADTTNAYLSEGLITRAERAALVLHAAQNLCERPETPGARPPAD